MSGFSGCQAENPATCRYHGYQAQLNRLNEAILEKEHTGDADGYLELRQEEEYLRKEYQVYQEAEKLAVEKQNKEQFLISHPQPDVDEYSYHEEDYLIDDEDRAHHSYYLDTPNNVLWDAVMYDDRTHSAKSSARYILYKRGFTVKDFLLAEYLEFPGGSRNVGKHSKDEHLVDKNKIYKMARLFEKKFNIKIPNSEVDNLLIKHFGSEAVEEPDYYATRDQSVAFLNDFLNLPQVSYENREKAFSAST